MWFILLKKITGSWEEETKEPWVTAGTWLGRAADMMQVRRDGSLCVGGDSKAGEQRAQDSWPWGRAVSHTLMPRRLWSQGSPQTLKGTLNPSRAILKTKLRFFGEWQEAWGRLVRWVLESENEFAKQRGVKGISGKSSESSEQCN